MKGQQVGTTRFVVMRYPVLQEDEGEPCFISIFRSEMKAKEWIQKQKGEYFKPEDYFICRESI